MTTPTINLTDVSHTFEGERGPVEAVRDVSLRVMPGEFVTLIGPSGSGKSTLFNIITGLLDPDSGSVHINGEPVSGRSGLVGYMPQRDLLLPWRTVIDNAIISLEISGVPPIEARQQAIELLPVFGLEGFGDSYPAALSGGMRQRAALLRTILTGCDTLLFDEPFGALDALTRRELQDWLLGLWRDMEKTVLFITHDVEEALYLGDRVVVLSERPGQVVLNHEVDLPRPRQRRMMAEPRFGEQMTTLLGALGLPMGE